MQCQEFVFLSGTKDSRREGRRWMMIPEVEGTNRNDKNIELGRQKVSSNRRLTIRMIANKLGISCERVWAIITEDLEMKKICSKMVTRLLKEEKIEQHVQVRLDMFKRLKTEPDLLRKVMTGDESWIFEYDPLTKK